MLRGTGSGVDERKAVAVGALRSGRAILKVERSVRSHGSLLPCQDILGVWKVLALCGVRISFLRRLFF